MEAAENPGSKPGGDDPGGGGGGAPHAPDSIGFAWGLCNILDFQSKFIYLHTITPPEFTSHIRNVRQYRVGQRSVMSVCKIV